MRIDYLAFSLVCLLCLAACSAADKEDKEPVWTPQEWQVIQSLALGQLSPAVDPSNRYASDRAAAELGKALFFDARLSRNGKVSCATCHQPAQYFSDGLPVAQGTKMGSRNTPSLLGVAWNTWFFWDGRKDSLWSQALAPLEDANEHNLSRTDIVRLLLTDPAYQQQYAQVFGTSGVDVQTLPADAQPSGTIAQIQAWKALTDTQRQAIDQQFANMGKAIAAYVTTLKPQPGRFDQYVAAKAGQAGASSTVSMSVSELRGLRLFIGAKAQCLNCHAGSLFTNQAFHAIGTAKPGDSGRAAVVDQVRLDRFNCLGAFSDAPATSCADLQYMQRNRHHLIGAYKTPSLRNVGNTAPYFHDGSKATLEEAVAHYADSSQIQAGKTDLPAIQLDEQERQDLVDFLRTLNAVTQTP